MDTFLQSRQRGRLWGVGGMDIFFNMGVDEFRKIGREEGATLCVRYFVDSDSKLH